MAYGRARSLYATVCPSLFNPPPPFKNHGFATDSHSTFCVDRFLVEVSQVTMFLSLVTDESSTRYSDVYVKFQYSSINNNDSSSSSNIVKFI